MVSFLDFLVPTNSGVDPETLDRARSQGMLNAAAALANLSAPGFNKAAPTPLQLVTGGLQGYQQGTQSGIDRYYTDEVNKSKAAMAGLDTTYANKMQPLMTGFDTSGFNTPPTAPQTPRTPQLTDYYAPPVANPSAPATTATGVGRPVNNPGNLRPVGASTGFRQFKTPEEGMAALTQDLAAKINGSPAMGGRPPTLRNIISVYSPATENATPQLIENAARRSGLNPDQPLTMADLPKLQQAILVQEQGGTGSALPSATGMNPDTGRPLDPIAAGTVQQPSGVPGDAYLGNQIRTIGMLQSMAGKPTGDNLLKMGLMTDPRFSFMRNDNTPAAIQVANAVMQARKSGNKEYEDAIIAASKMYDRGLTSDGAGGVTPVQGYTDAKGTIKQAESRGTNTGKNEAELSANYTKAQSSLITLERKSESVMKRIDKAVKLADSNVMGVDTATGYGNMLLGGLPNTNARALNNELLSIKASLGFDELQNMRNNSPTGGALGAVSEMENRLLQAVEGALDPLQGEQLKENLAVIKEMYPQVLAERRRAFEQDYGKVTPLGNNPVPPAGAGGGNSNGWSVKKVN